MTPFPAYKVVYDNNRHKRMVKMLDKIYNKIHDNSKRVIRFTNSKITTIHSYIISVISQESYQPINHNTFVLIITNGIPNSPQSNADSKIKLPISALIIIIHCTLYAIDNSIIVNKVPHNTSYIRFIHVPQHPFNSSGRKQTLMIPIHLQSLDYYM